MDAGSDDEPSRSHAAMQWFFGFWQHPARIVQQEHPGNLRLPGCEIPATQNYRAAKSRHLKTTGRNPEFQPGIPGRAWGWQVGAAGIFLAPFAVGIFHFFALFLFSWPPDSEARGDQLFWGGNRAGS